MALTPPKKKHVSWDDPWYWLLAWVKTRLHRFVNDLWIQQVEDFYRPRSWNAWVAAMWICSPFGYCTLFGYGSNLGYQVSQIGESFFALNHPVLVVDISDLYPIWAIMSMSICGYVSSKSKERYPWPLFSLSDIDVWANACGQVIAHQSQPNLDMSQKSLNHPKCCWIHCHPIFSGQNHQLPMVKYPPLDQ